MFTDFEIKAYQIYVLEYFDEHDANMCPACMEEFCENELEEESWVEYYEQKIADSKPILGKSYERIVQEIETKIAEIDELPADESKKHKGQALGLTLALELIEDYKNWY